MKERFGILPNESVISNRFYRKNVLDIKIFQELSLFSKEISYNAFLSKVSRVKIEYNLFLNDKNKSTAKVLVHVTLSQRYILF